MTASGTFRVRIEQVRGRLDRGFVEVEGRVDLPAGAQLRDVDLYWNDQYQTSVRDTVFRARLTYPDGHPRDFLRVIAHLEDGRSQARVWPPTRAAIGPFAYLLRLVRGEAGPGVAVDGWKWIRRGALAALFGSTLLLGKAVDQVAGPSSCCEKLRAETSGPEDEEPGSDPETPGLGFETPETDLETPTSEPETPTSEPETPTSEPETPTSEPETPTSEPEAPGSDPETPGSEPETPGSEPETPGSAPETPGSDPETPGSDPETPGSDPEAPGSDPEAPGSDPETPGSDPETPGSDPETPGSEPETPGSDPEAPGSGPETPPGTEPPPFTGQWELIRFEDEVYRAGDDSVAAVAAVTLAKPHRPASPRILVEGHNPRMLPGNGAAIYDSGTAEEGDLYTPAPGCGEHREATNRCAVSPATPALDGLCPGLENVLVVRSLDSEPLSPNDAKNPEAWLTLDFGPLGNTVTVARLDVLDVDADQRPEIVLLGASGAPLERFSLPGGGARLVRWHLGPTCGVSKMHIHLRGSGAIDNVVFRGEG